MDFSNILATSKRSPLKLESDGGAEFYNSFFQNSLKSKNIQHYSRFTDKDFSIAERLFRTKMILIMKPVFLKRNADWLKEISSVIKQYNNTIHSSTKMTPIQAFKKSKEKLVYSNIQDRKVKQQPKFSLDQLVRTSDIRSIFSKGDSTNYSYKFYTVTEVIYNTIPFYRLNYLTKRYDENLKLPTKLSLEENNQIMKELNLIQKNNKY